MNVKDRLLKALRNTPAASTGSGGAEIIVRCPRCGHLHLQAGPHLYIEANGDVMRINCFHCPLSGVLTPGILHEMGINDPEFDEYLTKINKTGISKIKTNSDGSKKWIIPTNYKESDLFKIKYSKERTGIDFEDPEIIRSYKLIYNLNEFCRVNNIQLQENPTLLNELSDHAIGFLSFNNNTLNMRNVDSPKLKRYTNIKINKQIHFPFMYIPPSNVDLMAINPLIVVAEGAYDILCIKKRFFADDATNIIFGAVGSKASYKPGILKLIQLTCFFGADISIFSDTDASLDDYRKMFNSNIMKCNNIKVYYNLLHKDFGNINEECKFKRYRLKRNA